MEDSIALQEVEEEFSYKKSENLFPHHRYIA
jgi:hypothetical protein